MIRRGRSDTQDTTELGTHKCEYTSVKTNKNYQISVWCNGNCMSEKETYMMQLFRIIFLLQLVYTTNCFVVNNVIFNFTTLNSKN